MNELYRILNVKPNATQEEIRHSFRRLAKETHPDLNGNDNKKVEQFKEIKKAYDILSDPEKRARYDAEQVKPKVSPSSNGYSSTVDEALRDRVLALLTLQIRLKRRRLCDFFIGCILVVLMGFVFWTRHSSEMRRILSLIKIENPKDALIILGILFGIAIVVLITDTFMISRIHFKLKKILKGKG